MGSRSRSRPARSSPCSARQAAARRPPCGCSAASRSRARARSTWGSTTSPGCRPTGGTSTPSFRATRSSRTPRVLLREEPLGALDLKLRKQMQLELKRIQSEVGITFVHVTHDQEEAMTMADQIAVLNRGRIEQLGAPTDLYERPATAFVAGFLGVSNLLAGVVAGEDRVRLDDGTEVRLPLGGRSGRVAVGVRPEKVRLGAGGGHEPPRTATQ